jgi:hypothetical protein
MIYIRDCSLKFKLEILQKETTENNAQNYEMFILSFICMHFILLEGGCCVHDHMVVGFTTTYAINAYHH